MLFIKENVTMELPFIRTPYNYDVNEATKESGLKCLDKTLAIQSAAEETDINTIVRRFGLTGQLPTDLAAPTYGDFTEVGDFQSAMIAISRARESFDKLPPDLRYRFGNDPGRFVDFCSDEKNRTEAEKMGLVLPKDEPQGAIQPKTSPTTEDPKTSPPKTSPPKDDTK